MANAPTLYTVDFEFESCPSRLTFFVNIRNKSSKYYIYSIWKIK